MIPNLRTVESIEKQNKNRPRGSVVIFGSPNRIRTGVLALKGRCPRPLDDGAKTWEYANRIFLGLCHSREGGNDGAKTAGF